MQQLKTRLLVKRTLTLMAIGSIIFSFTGKFGGDSFEIYLNNKLISQQFVTRHEAVKTLQLDESVSDGLVIINYSHCGAVGTERHIILKDENNNTIRNWKFANAKNGDKNMSCRVKEILDLQKNNGSRFNLYYSSKELPEERLLATVVLNTDTKRSS